MEDVFDAVIVGAGMVGLAAARALAESGRGVCLLERHDGFGRETSSRNSEVIHAGLYYQPGSLKARLCVEGLRETCALCEKWGVACRRTGKLVVACEEAELPALEALYENAVASGAPDLEIIGRAEIARLEPEVRAVAAIRSPRTGIFDSHAMMAAHERAAEDAGALVAYRSEVVGLEPRSGGGWRVTVREPAGETRVDARLVVNCAGLGAERIAALAGIDTHAAGYTLHPCKGEYFNVRAGARCGIRGLVYPLPPADGLSIGLHATLDLAGQVRLGPSAFYVDAIDYDVDPAARGMFFEAGRRYLPRLQEKDLSPGLAGVRPKLQGPGEGFRDFVIREESDRGAPGLIDLVGIESPGLTAAPAIARRVRELADAAL